MKDNLKILLIIGILFLSMIGFVRCYNFELINLDDYLYLTMHDYVREWQGIASIKDFFTNVSEGIWMPLTWFSYAVDYCIFNDWFGGFHLHSIFIHFLNACLLFFWLLLLFRNLEKRYAFCLVGTLIWAIHPLRCESVVLLASRKDLLSFFWEILALIFWTQATLTNEGCKKKVIILTLASYISFALGSMCKPSIMTLPILCFLIDLFVIRRVYVLRYICPVLYMLFLGGFTVWQQSVGGAIGNFTGEPIWNRILNAGAAFGIYIRNFLWPQWLAPQCLKIWPALPRFCFPGMIISIIVGTYVLSKAIKHWGNRQESFLVEKQDDIPILIKSYAPTNWLFVGLVWFSLSIFPMLGIVDFGFHAFADRFTYIPSVGISIIAIVFLNFLAKKIGYLPTIIFSIITTIALLFTTWIQTGYWKNDKTIFTRTLKVDGNHNAAAHSAIGNWYFEFNHNNKAAIKKFNEAMQINIDYVITSYPIYTIALSELGQDKEIARLLNVYEDELISKLGKERARKILSGHYDIDPRHQYLRTIYQASRIAWMLSSKESLTNAVEYFNKIDSTELNTNPIFLYLQLMFYRQTNNMHEADKIKLKLMENKKGFHRFRFLHR
jgi:hypothetical protein